MKWRAAVRVEDGEVKDLYDYTDLLDYTWRSMPDMAPSARGGIWVNVEVEDDSPPP